MALEEERPIPAVAQVGEKIAASKKTIVREQGDIRVVKEDLNIYDLKRFKGESDEDYRQRRLTKCLGFIKKELNNEKLASQRVPLQIRAPHEFHFIAEGRDGFPAPFRVQEKVPGQTLRQVGNLTLLSDEQQKDLDNLLRASLDSYRKHGHFLDLIGRAETEPENLLEDLKRHWSPLTRSNNIIVSPDGTLSLVDVRLSKKSPLKDVAKFFLIFPYLYRKRLKFLGSS